MPDEFKEKRSFDDILWNTFIVIMVIFLGYALLLPRIRHVVERIQGKKSAVVANAAPAKAAPEAEPATPAGESPNASSAPSGSNTTAGNSAGATSTSSAASAPPAASPHVTVNPPPDARKVAREPAAKPKAAPATKPAPASKPPVQTAPFQPRYAVDAGSYTIRANAERLTSEMPQKYQPHTTITPVKVRGKLFYRVRVVVATKAEADMLSAQLLEKEKVHAVILALR